jgi:hypothetical protein
MPGKPEELDRAARKLIAQLRTGAWFDSYRYDRDRGRYKAEGDPAWADSFNALLEACIAAMAAGEPSPMAQTAGRLLDALGLRDAYGACCEPEELIDRPMDELISLHLAALYLTVPATQRGARLVHRMHRLSPRGEGVDWAQIHDALPKRPPQWAAFLKRAHVALVRAPTDSWAWARHRGRLLRLLPRSPTELARLGRLAREAGEKSPHLYGKWIDALVSSRKPEAAVNALHEALGTIDTPWILPTLGARLARMGSLLERPELQVEGRQLCWRLAPSLANLLLLWAAASPDRVDAVIGHELGAAYEGAVPVDQGLVARMEVLLGQFEVSLARLEEADPEGWTRLDHPGEVVLPLLIRLGCGGGMPPGGGCVAAILQTTATRPAVTTAPEAPEGRDAMPTWQAALDATLVAHEDTAIDAPWYRSHAHSQLCRLTDHVVATKKPQLYDRVAELWAALAEAHHLGGDSDQAKATLAEPRARHPRNKGLQRRVAELWLAKGPSLH